MKKFSVRLTFNFYLVSHCNISSQLLLAVATCVNAAVVPKSGAHVSRVHVSRVHVPAHVPKVHVPRAHVPVHTAHIAPVHGLHYGKREAEADPTGAHAIRTHVPSVHASRSSDALGGGNILRSRSPGSIEIADDESYQGYYPPLETLGGGNLFWDFSKT